MSEDEVKTEAEKKEQEKPNSEVKFEENKEEFKREEGKLGIEIDDTPVVEPVKEKHKEIAGEEVEKEGKVFVVEKEKPADDDEVALDLSKLKGSFKNLFKKKDKKEKFDSKKTFEEKSSESVSLDFKGVEKFFKNYKKWIIPIVLILIAVSFSVYFRTMPQRLPITDDWAENSVYNFYRRQFASQIEQQYPNLPAQNKNNLANQELQKFLSENKDQVKQQIKATSEQFKQSFKMDDGQTYLLAIDPWVWYGLARNYVENGHWGNDFDTEGNSIYTLRNGRFGQSVAYSPLSFSIVLSYGFFKILGNNSLMTAAFYVPVILISLATIGMFFVGKKIAGNVGGFVTALIFAIHPALLGRTSGGFTDTDLLIGFFQAFTLLFFILAFEEKITWKKITYFVLFGLFMAFYEHDSWWYMIDLLLISLVVYFAVYLGISFYKKEKFNFKKRLIFPLAGLLLSYSILKPLMLFIIGREISLKELIFGPFLLPFSFISSKQVAVSTIWPNVLTTVAELNKSTLMGAISQVGGKLLFFISLTAIVILAFKKSKHRQNFFYAGLLLVWFVTTIYAAQTSLRFGSMIVPAFALSFGVISSFLYYKVSSFSDKHLHVPQLITKIIALILVGVIVVLPLFQSAYATGKNEIPSMNDAWYDALTKIKDNSEDAIITSWWDFGHWFVAVARRRVTFDGGDQGERIHWVGKTLLTSDESVSIGLLRMLNCGQEKPVHVLEDFFDGDAVKAVGILNSMMILNDENEAIKFLKKEGLTTAQIAEIISITYCDNLIDQFYIASEDMIGKSGVWGHFGSWDFEKAKRYYLVHGKSRQKGVKILMEQFNFSEEEAEERYSEIQSVDNADTWVSPWPNYMSGQVPCQKDGNLVQCQVGAGGGTIPIEIDLISMDATIENIQEGNHPHSIVFATKEGVEEKFFEESAAGFSVVLIPNGDSFRAMLTHPLQARSMFTQLFFFEGHGLECFDLFDKRQQVAGGLIYTYKVDFDCVGKNKVYYLPEEEIKAQHILIRTTGARSDEEALVIIEAIAKNVNADNFEESAEEYSEDPGTKDNGGDLGWFGKDEMVEEFEKAAYALEIGEISEPVKTEFGYHLIKLTGRREVEHIDVGALSKQLMESQKQDDNSNKEESQDEEKTFKVSV